MVNPVFEDEDFLDQLVRLLTVDYKSLQDCGGMLHPDDFKPLKGMRRGRPRWIVAERALEHYQKYREPLGKLLTADVLDYAHNLGMSKAQMDELKDYCLHLRKLKLSAPEAVISKVTHYKVERIRAAAIDELSELHSTGMLTSEKWQAINQRVMAVSHGRGTELNDYLNAMPTRLSRRATKDAYRVPWTFIDPLDSMIKGVGRKQLGVALAPYGRGKSLFLLWMAAAYVFQRLNVLYLTLEDPMSDVEDRLDSIITKVPIQSLADMPRTVEKRFTRWRSMLTTRIKIHDGTDGGVTIPKVEQMILQERDQGFIADAVIIDYDDEIVPTVKQKERRFEFADIYRDYRQLLSRYNMIGWTAAQTQRGTEDLKILSGDKVAEDISKLRKATVGLSLGKGDWTDDSIYLWVAKHKFDKQHQGCEIIPDLSRMLIYSRDDTFREARNHQI